jgi:perosamine synthetase
MKIKSLSQKMLNDFHAILGPPLDRVELHEPDFGSIEKEYVLNCLDSGYVSSIGRYVGEFEARLEAFTGAKYAIAVVNGTSALHLALILAGVKCGDEVLMPAISFVATANAASYIGAIPHFLDSEIDTMGIDPDALRAYLKKIASTSNGMTINKLTGKKIAAIIPMHTFGHPVKITEILKISADYNISVVEDAAESLGSYCGGKHTGTFGVIGILSFNGNKTITTGGGGAILTNDEDIALRAKHLSTTARVNNGFDFYHDQIGWNYRMPNLNAALGCAQLDRLPGILLKKRALAEAYDLVFSKYSELHFFREPIHTSSNYWLNTIQLLDLKESSLYELSQLLLKIPSLYTLE